MRVDMHEPQFSSPSLKTLIWVVAPETFPPQTRRECRPHGVHPVKGMSQRA